MLTFIIMITASAYDGPLKLYSGQTVIINVVIIQEMRVFQAGKYMYINIIWLY